MTPERFVKCMEALHWSNDQLAEVFECDESLIEAWAMGLEEIPPKVAAWLHALATVHIALESDKPRSIRGKRATSFSLN